MGRQGEGKVPWLRARGPAEGKGVQRSAGKGRDKSSVPTTCPKVSSSSAMLHRGLLEEKLGACSGYRKPTSQAAAGARPPPGPRNLADRGWLQRDTHLLRPD